VNVSRISEFVVLLIEVTTITSDDRQASTFGQMVLPFLRQLTDTENKSLFLRPIKTESEERKDASPRR